MSELGLPPSALPAALGNEREELSRSPVRAALCVVYSPVSPPLSGAFAFRGEALRIGRHVDNEISLGDDAAASRVHARIERRGDAVFVVDQGSTNGTWLDGERIHEARLTPHALLRVGNTLFRFAEDDLDVLLRYDPESTRRPSRLVGGARMRVLSDEVWRLSRTPGNVLIEGQDGTGKQMVGRELHELSGRKGRFVFVACRGRPRKRIEIDLFGGKNSDGSVALGALERAQGGTLYLEDPSEMPLETQARLVGAMLSMGDVRIVTASRTSLERAVSRGAFRGDLLAKVGPRRLSLPTLRERREDLVPLIEDTLAQIGKYELLLSIDFVDALARYDFPGNVRELIEIVKQAAHQCQGDALLLSHLPRGLAERDVGNEDLLTAAEPTATVRVPKSLSSFKS